MHIKYKTPCQELSICLNLKYLKEHKFFQDQNAICTYLFSVVISITSKRIKKANLQEKINMREKNLNFADFYVLFAIFSKQLSYGVAGGANSL